MSRRTLSSHDDEESSSEDYQDDGSSVGEQESTIESDDMGYEFTDGTENSFY